MFRSRSPLGVVLAALLAAFVVVGTATPSLAKERHGPSVTQNGPSDATLSNTQTTTTTTPGHGGSSPSSSSNNSGSSNSSSGSTFPGINSGPATGPGTGACDPANYPGGYSDTLAVPAPCAPVEQCGAYQGSVFVNEPCPEEAEEGEEPAAPVITTQMVTEAAKVTAPVSPPHVEPGNRSYVNIPNNYWTNAPTVNTAITLLGQRIALHWAPTGTTWSFGDGATATGNGLKGAAVGAAGALEHSYTRQGSYDITTTTTYNLTFVLPGGGGAQTVQLVSPASPAVTLPVSEIQTRVDYVR